MSELVKLHLGCGRRDFGPEWVHVDAETNPKYKHIRRNSVTSLPWEDEKVDLIYASHLLEYFDAEEAVVVLKEWWRVLKYGGILRLAVPDFGAMAHLYSERGEPLNLFVGPLYGRMLCNGFFIYHKLVYDFGSLSMLLTKIGFHEVARYDWRETEHAHIDDYSQAYIPHLDKQNGTLISLNVEAVK